MCVGAAGFELAHCFGGDQPGGGVDAAAVVVRLDPVSDFVAGVELRRELLLFVQQMQLQRGKHRLRNRVVPAHTDRAGA